MELKLIMKEALVPKLKGCRFCCNTTITSCVYDDEIYFFCYYCYAWTKWNYRTILHYTRLKTDTICLLLMMFIDGKSVQDACDYFRYLPYSCKPNIKTVRRYFTLFLRACLLWYREALHTILLEGEVEIDETYLYKEKASKAPHRPYVCHRFGC